MHTITTFWCKKPVHVTKVIIGDIYEYQPANPAATRNRGRQGLLIEFNNDQYRTDLSKNATIKWLDTKRTSQVDIGSFIHISDALKTKEQLAAEAFEYQRQRIEEYMNQPHAPLDEPASFEFEKKSYVIMSAGRTKGELDLGILYPGEKEITISKFEMLPRGMQEEIVLTHPYFFRMMG